MQTLTIITNGTRREFDGKLFRDEFRIYRVRGDVTKREELEEAAQEIAIKTGADLVTMQL